LIAKAPWRMARLARDLAESHAAINRVEAPAALPELKTMLAARIRETSLGPELKSFALEHVDAIPDGDRLSHGDFHPANVLVTGTGVSVIDWPNASRGHPGADHARTLLMLTAGDPPPLPPHIRAIVAAGRRLFSRIYAGKYRRLVPVDRSLLQHAHIAHVAARIWEGIDVEIPKLTASLEKAVRRA
jgi:aminoglycoside phosphotransferase (APT) family kinase protein